MKILTSLKLALGQDNHKNKPKMPARLYTNYNNQGPRITVLCPCCDYNFGEYLADDNNKEHRPDECPYCKQKLDWTKNL